MATEASIHSLLHNHRQSRAGFDIRPQECVCWRGPYAWPHLAMSMLPNQVHRFYFPDLLVSDLLWSEFAERFKTSSQKGGLKLQPLHWSRAAAANRVSPHTCSATSSASAIRSPLAAVPRAIATRITARQNHRGSLGSGSGSIRSSGLECATAAGITTSVFAVQVLRTITQKRNHPLVMLPTG